MLRVEKIPSITFSRMKNETHVQFHDNMSAFVDKYDAEQLGILQLYVPYYRALGNEREALLIITKSELSEQIAEKDRERGSVYRSFSTTVKGLRGHFDLETRQMANAVWGLFLHYGNVPKKPLNDETAAIDDMAREFERPDMAQKLEALKLTAWKDKLVEVNQEVKQLMLDRLSENANKTAFRMKTAREETDKFYNAIIAHLNIRLMIEENVDEKTDAFIAEIVENIRKFKLILAQDLGRKKWNSWLECS